jgi:predicted nucleic acid-binding protein
MMNSVLVDTNVLLDVLLRRQPFVEDAQRIWSIVERGQIQGLVSAVSILNVNYIVRRLASRQEAERAVKGILAVFQVVPVDRELLSRAIEAHFPDFEDAVQSACADRGAAGCIVTRNERDFARSSVPAIAPDAFLAKIESE